MHGNVPISYCIDPERFKHNSEHKIKSVYFLKMDIFKMTVTLWGEMQNNVEKQWC